LNNNKKRRLIADEKDGFYKIPNSLSEALCVADFTKTQHAIFQFLLRRTNGWRRNGDAISLQEFAKGCKTDRIWISKQLKDLVNKNVLLLTGRQNQKYIYQINLEISSWDPSCIDLNDLEDFPRGCPHIEKTIAAKTTKRCGKNHDSFESFNGYEVLSSSTTPIISETLPLSPATTPPLSSATTPLLSCTTTLESASPLEEREEEGDVNTLLNTNKDNIKESIILKVYFEEGIYYSLAKLLADNNSDPKMASERPDLQLWSDSIYDMVNYDRRHPKEIERIIRFSQKDEFWSKMIPNPEKLRFFYDHIKDKRLRKIDSRLKRTRNEEDTEKIEDFFAN